MNSVLSSQFPQLFSYLSEGKISVAYDPKTRSFGVTVADGPAYQEIAYDPWSGAKLPDSLFDEYMRHLEALGLDAGSNGIPAEFLTEEWWVSRGL